LWSFCQVWAILSQSAITHLTASTKWTRKSRRPSLDQHQEQFDMAPLSTRFGGVNMHQLKDIQGSGQIVQLLKHLRIQSPFQKMWLIALHWAQLQSGFHTPLLQDPTVPAPHLDSLYISSLREWKYCHRALLHYSITAGPWPYWFFLFVAGSIAAFFRFHLDRTITRSTTNSVSIAIMATCKSTLVQHSYGRTT
jgi:hypothetical protein